MPPKYDVAFLGGKVVDGQSEPRRADVGVVGATIAHVGAIDAAEARTVVDATGRVVSPGFIDVHVHAEISQLGGRDQYAGLLQGVTTQLMGPDGFGWAGLPPDRAREMWEYTEFLYREPTPDPTAWPTVEAYLASFAGRIPGNCLPQAPHGAIRLKAMGWAARPATEDELQAMKDETRRWMEAGATGLCCGLDYQPGANADRGELVELAKVVKEYGGVYAAHQRGCTLGRRGAWEETLAIGRESGAKVHISHERVDDEVQDLLDAADRDGTDLTFESYLYAAGMTHLSLLLPQPAQHGTVRDMLRRLADPDCRCDCVALLQARLAEAGGAQIIGSTKTGRFIGQTVSDAATSAKQSLGEFACDLIVQEEGLDACVLPWGTPDAANADVFRRTLRHPRMMVASDGIYNIAHPHPRGYGCFARVLGRFVREQGVVSLGEAVYKMSGFPAKRFGLADRGAVAAGFAADLVLFDPLAVADAATFADPLLPPVGVAGVWVNGVPVVLDGKPTGHLPGVVLRRQQ